MDRVSTYSHESDDVPNTLPDAIPMLHRKYEKYVQIAPMLAVTDTHFRRFFRGISREAELWTEMCVDSTLNHTSKVEDFLDFHPSEHPVICQIGGSNPTTMAQAAAVVAKWGYDGVNINCGCPSQRVSGKGRFGSFLMKQPETVLSIVSAIHRSIGTQIPISVKCRAGVDRDYDSFTSLNRFIETVSSTGHCDRFIIHARKAWLCGINPKQNRSIPPLKYHRVYQLANLYPHLNFALNGGISSIETIESLLHCTWRPNAPSATVPSSQVVNDPLDKHDHNPFSSTKRIKKNDVPIKQNKYTVLPTLAEKSVTCEKCSSDSSAVSHSSPSFEKEEAPHAQSEKSFSKKNYPSTMLQEDDAPTFTYDDILHMMTDLERRVNNDLSCSVLKGIMVGRAALSHPCLFSCIDSRFYGIKDPPSARTVRSLATYYIDYLDSSFPTPEYQKSTFTLMKPILGLLTGLPGCKFYRKQLDSDIRQHGNKISPGHLLYDVLRKVDEHFPGSLDTCNIVQCSDRCVVDSRDW